MDNNFQNRGPGKQDKYPSFGMQNELNDDLSNVNTNSGNNIYGQSGSSYGDRPGQSYNGYGHSAGYGQGAYGQNTSYGAGHPNYGGGTGRPNYGGYGQGAGYGTNGGYRQGAGYGTNGGYGQGAGYGTNGGYGQGAGYGANGGYGQGAGYGAGRPNYGGVNYGGGRPTYGNGPYGNNMYGEPYGGYGNTYGIRKPKRSVNPVVVLVTVFAIVALIMGGSFINDFTDIFVQGDVTDLEEQIEGKYGVTIKSGDDADVSLDGYKIERMDKNRYNKKALEAVDKVLGRLPEGFLDELMNGYKPGRYLEINITGEMVQRDGNRDLAGITNYEEKKDIIRLNADTFSWDAFEETFAHELWHVIDFEMHQFDERDSAYKNWKKLNPQGFEYSFEEGRYKEYTEDGGSISNVYFVSLYSKEGIAEDRAEIFGILLAADDKSEIPKSLNSSHIKAKIKLICDELDDNFDSVSGNDNYWQKWK